MKKRFLGLFLVFAMLFACIPGMAAQAAGEDLSKNVKVSEFHFLTDDAETSVLTPGKTVTAECMLERTEVGAGAQDYCFILQVIDNGELIDLQKTTGSISVADGKKKISVTSAVMGEDTSKYEVVALLVSDPVNLFPLAMPANFKNSTCRIASLTVAGNKVSLEAGKTDYSMDLKVMQSEMPPAIEVVPYDLSTSITVNNISGTSSTATVTAVSHDGTATAQYNIALNITTMKNAALKSIELDGNPLEHFDPNVLEYTVNLPVGSTDVPAVTYETALASTEVAVTAATELPGDTVLKTKAADGSDLTYKIRFAKTVEMTPESIAQGKWPSTIQKVIPSQFDTFQSYNYGDIGEVLLTYFHNEHKTDEETWAYMGFQTNIPEDAVIESAELDLVVRARNNIDSTPMHLELYENTDLSWMDSEAGERTVETLPSISENRLDQGNVDLVPSEDNFTKYTYTLQKSALEGKQDFGVCAMVTEPNNDWNKLCRIVMKTGYTPILRISYCKAEEMETGQLKRVTVDGENYVSFDPNVYEYKIPAAAGQTTAPIINAFAPSGTTVSVTQAAELPGKATVTTQAENGASKTYTFIFMKTVAFTPTSVAQGKWPSNLQKIEPSQFDTFQSYNWGGTGEMLTIYFQSEHRMADETWAYMGFDTHIPENVVIENAELDLSIGTVNKLDTNPLHVGLYENTDLSWMSGAAGEQTVTTLPAISDSRLNTENLDLTAPVSDYTKYTYKLDKSALVGKQDFGVCAMVTESCNSFEKYVNIAMKSGYTPVLRISYSKAQNTEQGALKRVTIGEENFASFDPDIYEYKIPTEVGQSTVPEVNAFALDGTTVSVTQAAELPGKATVTTQAENGASKTYTFIFMKTVAFTPTSVAQGKWPSNLQKIEPSQFDTFQSYNWGGTGEMLTIYFQSEHRMADETWAYMGFDTHIPENVVIENAELDLSIGTVNKLDTNPLHVGLYENTDLSWMSGAAGEQTVTTLPAISDSRLNTENLDLTAPVSDYTKYTYKLDKSALVGKQDFGVCAMVTESCNSFEKYVNIAMKSGYTPVLRISYYEE